MKFKNKHIRGIENMFEQAQKLKYIPSTIEVEESEMRQLIAELHEIFRLSIPKSVLHFRFINDQTKKVLVCEDIFRMFNTEDIDATIFEKIKTGTLTLKVFYTVTEGSSITSKEVPFVLKPSKEIQHETKEVCTTE